jgi:hypothetical protein
MIIYLNDTKLRTSDKRVFSGKLERRIPILCLSLNGSGLCEGIPCYFYCDNKSSSLGISNEALIFKRVWLTFLPLNARLTIILAGRRPLNALSVQAARWM